MNSSCRWTPVRALDPPSDPRGGDDMTCRAPVGIGGWFGGASVPSRRSDRVSAWPAPVVEHDRTARSAREVGRWGAARGTRRPGPSSLVARRRSGGAPEQDRVARIAVQVRDGERESSDNTGSGASWRSGVAVSRDESEMPIKVQRAGCTAVHEVRCGASASRARGFSSTCTHDPRRKMRPQRQSGRHLAPCAPPAPACTLCTSKSSRGLLPDQGRPSVAVTRAS